MMSSLTCGNVQEVPHDSRLSDIGMRDGDEVYWVPQRQCVCGSTTALKICFGCMVVGYCCKQHQKYDWERHKLECPQMLPFGYLRKLQKNLSRYRVSKINTSKSSRYCKGLIEFIRAKYDKGLIEPTAAEEVMRSFTSSICWHKSSIGQQQEEHVEMSAHVTALVTTTVVAFIRDLELLHGEYHMSQDQYVRYLPRLQEVMVYELQLFWDQQRCREPGLLLDLFETFDEALKAFQNYDAANREDSELQDAFVTWMRESPSATLHICEMIRGDSKAAALRDVYHFMVNRVAGGEREVDHWIGHYSKLDGGRGNG